MGGVTIDPNLKKEAVRLDINGNIINPKTKEIVQPNAPDYIPTKEEIELQINAPKVEPVSQDISTPKETKTISEQIEEAKAHLADLELKKKQEIERMKEELAKLEQL